MAPDPSATVLENIDEKIGTMNKTPTGLGSGVRILEELGKRETPLSLSGNESVTLLPAGQTQQQQQSKKPKRDST